MLTSFDQLGAELTRNDRKLKMFERGVKMAPTGGRQFFKLINVGPKVNATDTYVYDSIALPTGEGEDYNVSSPVKGYELELTQAKYTDSFERTKEAAQYDQYNVVEILAGIQGLGTSTTKAFDLFLQLLLANAAAGSYTNSNGDTVSCLNANGENYAANTHTVRSGASYDNLDPTAFGETGLENHELLFRLFVNHAGRQLDVRPTHIFHTSKPSLKNDIKIYLTATGQNFGVSNSNAYTGRYQTIEMEHLWSDADGNYDSTKDDYWGLVVAKSPEARAEISQMPIIYPPQLVLRNRNVLVQTDMHFAAGIRDSNFFTLANV